MRSRSTERSGWRRAEITRVAVTEIHNVATSLASNEKSKVTSLITPKSASPSRSMRVDREPSFSASKNDSGSPAFERIQVSAPAWLRLMCSQTKPLPGCASSEFGLRHRLDGQRRLAGFEPVAADQAVIVGAEARQPRG